MVNPSAWPRVQKGKCEICLQDFRTRSWIKTMASRKISSRTKMNWYNLTKRNSPFQSKDKMERMKMSKEYHLYIQDGGNAGCSAHGEDLPRTSTLLPPSPNTQRKISLHHPLQKFNNLHDIKQQVSLLFLHDFFSNWCHHRQIPYTSWPQLIFEWSQAVYMGDIWHMIWASMHSSNSDLFPCIETIIFCLTMITLPGPNTGMVRDN